MKKIGLIALAAITTAAILSGCNPGNNGEPEEEFTITEFTPEPGMTSDQKVLGECSNLLDQWEAAKTYGYRAAKRLEERLSIIAGANTDVLLRAASSRNAGERAVAAAALGFGKGRTKRDYMMKLLTDVSPDVVANALLGIYVFGDPKTLVEPITAFLASDNVRLRYQAALALSGVLRKGDSRGALEPLIAVLDDDDTYVLMHTLNALGVVADPRAVEAIHKRCIAHPEPIVRYSAAAALGEIADFSSVPHLIKMLTDETKEIKTNALWALRRISGDYSRDESPDSWIEWLEDETERRRIREEQKTKLKISEEEETEE